MKRLLALSFALACALGACAELCISEICPKPKGFDPNGFESGWIELYNPGDAAENLSDYTLDRFDCGKKAEAGKFGALPNLTVPAKGYQVVYASEEYPQVAVGSENPFVTNGCVVVPFKVNPKKYPLIRLLKGTTVLDQFVVPVELDDNRSFAPAAAFSRPTRAAAPLQLTGANAACMFAKNQLTGASKYLVEVDPTSPAAIFSDELLTNVPLVTTKSGFYTDNMGDAEGEYVTLPTRKGKLIGTWAFSSEATPLSLSLTTLQGKRIGTVLTVR